MTEVRSLGQGVALRVRSAALNRLHADLARCWQSWLTPEDARRLDAHITIQNRVSSEKARATLAAAAANLCPGEVGATELAVRRYLGGPWEPVTTTKFASLP